MPEFASLGPACPLIVKPRLGACQIRLDFLDFDLSGDARLEVQLGETAMVLEGSNTGNHVYLPVSEEGNDKVYKAIDCFRSSEISLNNYLPFRHSACP